jgi:hypothetical protein
MITVKEFLEACQWRITGGDEYQWRLFGNHARYLDSHDPAHGSMSMVFDTRTQEVYIAEIHTEDKAYRIINPKYLKAYEKECTKRKVKFREATESYDFTDLEVAEDWIEKATAIMAGKEYDTRIQVPLTLPDDEMFQLMKLAHENDITLNQMVEKVLRLVIEKEKLNG